jgi:hypothetical protein
MTKYEPLLHDLNLSIASFNQILAREYQLPTLDRGDTKSCSSIANVVWDDQFWPHKDGPGVYFLFAGREGAAEGYELGLYVGKSSLGNIGTRIYRHLHPHRGTGIYTINDASGDPYVVEFIAAIPIPDRRVCSLASALEEHIISSVRGDIHLLNSVNNRE